jgi:hypothetical protein
VIFNGASTINIKEYKTEEQCNKAQIRIKQEIKDVYNVDAETVCLYTIQHYIKH